MAGSINKITLIGNVGRDPDIRSTQGGGKIANLSIATSESWTDKQSGERREKTQWHRVAIFNERLVENVEKYVTKGMRLYVEGQMEYRKFTDKDGNERDTAEVVLKGFGGTIVFLSRSDGAGGGDQDQSQARGKQAPSKQAGKPAAAGSWAPPSGGDLDDEIPF